MSALPDLQFAGNDGRPKLGLALGGGAARGVAHLGVLKVLDEAQIPIDYLAGSSVGSIIAAAYASGASIEKMLSLAQEAKWSKFGRMTASKMGLQTNRRLETFLRQFLVKDFADLRIPTAVVATDLISGDMVTLGSGDLARAVRASCTIPGIYLPVSDEHGHMLVDGGLVNILPAGVVRAMGADYVVAVSVNTYLQIERPANVFQVLLQSLALATRASESRLEQDADLVIQPMIRHVRWDDLSQSDRLFAAGETAMREALPQLRFDLERLSAGQTQSA